MLVLVRHPTLRGYILPRRHGPDIGVTSTLVARAWQRAVSIT